MKKIFTTLALAFVAMSGFAQATQKYVRVEFSVPITNFDFPEDPAKKGKTSVASAKCDDYVYPNPLNPYLDFNVTEHPITYRTTNPTNLSESSYFYLDQVRNTQYFTEDKVNKTKYDCQNITKMTAYEIPVETVKLLNTDTAAVEMDKPYIGNNKKYKIGKFTFNRLPRNVAELKTLIEPNGKGERVGCHNPMYIAAVMYLVWPRLLDCSQDCRDMVDYLFGKFDNPRPETYGISNRSWQNLCIATYNGNKGKDANGYHWEHNKLFEYFYGAKPSNQYMPNGDMTKGYFNQDSYTVYVAWDTTEPLMRSGDYDCTIARFLLISNPDATSKNDIAFDDPTAKVVMVRTTKHHGCYFQSNAEIYYGKGRHQTK